MKKKFHKVMGNINTALGGRLFGSAKVYNIYSRFMSGDYKFDGFEIYIPPGRIDAWTDDNIERFILKNAKDCIFWDIGANIGYFSISAARVAKSVRSFEPEEKNYKILKNNVGKNDIDNIKLHKIAVSDLNGESELFINTTEGSGIHSLAYDERLNKESDTIKTRTFDSLTGTYGNPDLVKIDVEGAELKIIEGAEETLKNGNIDWFIEVHSSKTGKRIDRIKQHGGDASSLYDKLSKHDYQVYGFHPMKEQEPFHFKIHEERIPLYWYATKG